MEQNKHDQLLVGKCIDMIVLQALLISEECLNRILNSPELLNSLIDKMMDERSNKMQKGTQTL